VRYLAIDLGLKRIGLAMNAQSIVTPLPAIERKNRDQAASEVRQVMQEYVIDAIVFGIPMGGSSEAEMRRRVAHFANLLQTTLPVFYQDESDSSLEAKALLQGEIKMKRDGRIDSLAAKIILERYLQATL